eukprot:scaffold15247_cov128-Isochrysis_galbana.AAC.1
MPGWGWSARHETGAHLLAHSAVGAEELAPVVAANNKTPEKEKPLLATPRAFPPACGPGRRPRCHTGHAGGVVLAAQRISGGDSVHTPMNSAPGPPGDDSALFVIGLIGADASQGGAALQFANQLAGTWAFRQWDASATPSALFHHDVERGVLYVAMMTKPAPLASRLADTVGPLAAETPPPASASPGVIQSWIAGHAHNHVRALLLLASACHMVLIVSDRCSTDLPLLQTLRSVWELRVQTRSSVNAIIAGARGGTPPAAAALGFVFGPVPDALAADIASAAAATPPVSVVGGQAASAATAAGSGAGDSRGGASSQADAARSGARAPGTNGGAVRVVGQVGPGLRGGRGGR